MALPAHFAKTEQGAALAQIGQPVVEAAGGGEVVPGPGKVRFAPQMFYFFRPKATGSTAKQRFHGVFPYLKTDGRFFDLTVSALRVSCIYLEL